MSLFKRRLETKEWTRMNIARTVYATVIKQCNLEAHTRQQYEQLPIVAARRAVEYADALMEHLEHNKK